MKTKTALLLSYILLAFALSTFAEASEWESLGSGSEAALWIDKSSIARKGEYLKAWIDMDFFTAQQGNSSTGFKLYKSMRGLHYFNCTTRERGLTQIAFYDKSNHYIDGVGPNDVRLLGYLVVSENELKMSEVAPDTVGASELDYVCKYKSSLKQ